MLPQTGVTFSCDDAALQKLFDEAERKCLHNLKDFGADTVLVEGGGYEKIWLETQPMGGEMYWKRNMTAAHEPISCCSCAPSVQTGGLPGRFSAIPTGRLSRSSTSFRASASRCTR